jgi:hypothetical protein
MATLATLSSLYQTSASGSGFPACLHSSMVKNTATVRTAVSHNFARSRKRKLIVISLLFIAVTRFM